MSATDDAALVARYGGKVVVVEGAPENLKVTTPTDTEITMTRVFDAPRHIVFDAWTRPELVRRWYGARGWNIHHNTDLWRIAGPVDGAFYGLWPMGGDTVFVPGHGPTSTFAHERATNPYVGDRALAAA